MADPKKSDPKPAQAGVVTTQAAEKEPPPPRAKKVGPKPGSPAHEISVMHRMTKLMGELSAGGRKRVRAYLRSVDEDESKPADVKKTDGVPY